MEIIKHPNKILETPSDNVLFSPKTIAFVKEFEEFYFNEFRNRNAAGLAAPQVGKNWNIFIAQGQVFINPKITKSSTANIDGREGCFSLEDGVFFNVKRAGMIRLEWIDKEGKPQNQKFFGFDARVIQHEMDHLLGKLCNGK